MLLFIGLFAIPLMLIAFIWICVHMIKLYYKKDLNKRKMIGCIFSIFISIGTIFILVQVKVLDLNFMKKIIV